MRKANVVFLLILVISTLLTGCFDSTTKVNRLSDYEKKRETPYYWAITDVLPEINELPEYINIEYQYRHTRTGPVFQAETMRLVVVYDKGTYENEKIKLGEKSFLDSAVPKLMVDGSHSVYYLIPEVEFSIGSYNFRVLAGEGFLYPHNIGFIATSDKKNSVAYLYFYDQDLDIISKDNKKGSMEKFIKNYFEYDW